MYYSVEGGLHLLTISLYSLEGSNWNFSRF